MSDPLHDDTSPSPDYGEERRARLRPPPARPLTVVTWYSFKGGVGRTMSLANVACVLAHRQIPVAVLDLDLEAPGLHTVPPFAGLAHRSGGFTGWLAELQQGRRGVGDLDQYFVPCPVAGGAEIRFLPAGPPEPREHVLALRRLRDDGLFSSTDPTLLFGLRQVRAWLAEQGVQYLLVDARTGFSELGAVTTVDLSDGVVLVTGLNENNLAYLGTVKALLLERRPQLGGGRILPVVTRLAAGETLWHHEAQAAAEEELEGCGPVIEVQPWSGAAFRAGGVALEDWMPTDLKGSYVRLAEQLLELSPLDDRPAEEARTTTDLEVRLRAAREEVSQRPDDAMARYALAVVLRQAGEDEASLAALREAAARAPDNVRVLAELAKRLFEGEEFEEAQALYERLVELSGDPSESFRALQYGKLAANCAFLRGQRDADREILEEARALADATYGRHFGEGPMEVLPRLRTLYVGLALTRARVADLLDDREKARQIFDEALRLLPEDDQVHRDYLTFLSREPADYEELEQTALRLLGEGRVFEDALRQLMGVLMKTGRPRQAIDLLQELRRSPSSQGGLPSLLLGVVYARMRQHGPAIAMFEEATRLDRSLVEAWQELGGRFLIAGRSAEALAAATVLVDEFGDGLGHVLRAVALVDLERHVDALPDIRTALEAGHRPAAFLERAAEAATEAEDYDLAERCHELLLARDDLTESQRAGALASAAYFLARHRPDEVTRAQAYVAEALRLRPTRTAVRASATIVEIETALQRAAAPESVDLSPYVEMLRDGGSPSGYRRGPAHGLLERILAAPAAGPENRFAAGAMLAQSRIDSGSFDEARALVQRLESMDLPPDLQPALVELRLSLYGAGREASPLDETSLREPPEPPDEPGLA